MEKINGSKTLVSFSPVMENDLPLLYSWFKKPHIEKWWPVPEGNEFFANFLERIRSKNTRPFMVFINEISIGYIQYYYIDRTQEKTGSWLPKELPATTIGIDQFIGDENFLGKGYGSLFIQAFIKQLQILEPATTTVIVDPDPENIAAIKCYKKVGFQSMGIFQAPWGPALLMKYLFAILIENKNDYHSPTQPK